MLTEPSLSPRIPELDGLRATAILLVLGCHIQGFLNMFPSKNIVGLFLVISGWNGVYLFFVLSGFLIGGLCFDELRFSQSIDLFRFWGRRALRTWPLYFFALAINYLFIRVGQPTPPLVYYLTFTQCFSEKLYFFIESWTLCAEEHFYFFLPIILVFLYRKGETKRIFQVLLLLFSAAYGYRLWNGYSLNTFGVLDSLMIGVILAYWRTFDFSRFERLQRFPNLTLLAGAAIVYIPFLFSLTFRSSAYIQGLQGIGFGLILAASMNPKIVIGPYLRSKVCRYLAKISYSIYLCHMPVILTTQKLTVFFKTPWMQILIYTLSICLIFLLAHCLYYLIEKPWLDLRQRIFKSYLEKQYA